MIKGAEQMACSFVRLYNATTLHCVLQHTVPVLAGAQYSAMAQGSRYRTPIMRGCLSTGTIQP